MSAGQREPGAQEIVQTRELTARERHDLTRAWVKACWGSDDGWFVHLVSYLWYGFAGFLSLSIVMAVNRLAEFAPTLSAQLALAAIGFAVALTLGHWLTNRQYRAKLWSVQKGGDRYAIQPDGMRANTARGAFSCGWGNIESIVNDERHLIALLPGYGGLFMVKAAFDGQDVNAFAAKLQHLWEAARGIQLERSR